MEEEQLILESLVQEHKIRRRKLLPLWIKIFIWIFIVLGAFAVLGFIGGLLLGNFQASLYGLETSQASSPTGLFIFFLFALKGLAAIGLWTEKDWAVNVAFADAVIGITVCIAVMFVPSLQPTPNFTFRFELVLLVPFLIKLLKMREAWEKAAITL
jgi:hypothetical protein